MLQRIRSLLVMALCTSIWGGVRAADLYVICHSGVALGSADIRDVFLGERQFAGTIKLLPADNGALQSAFLEKALKMDATKYSTLWTKKSFREGLNPPPVKGSDGEALEYVKRTAGACSYVTAQPADGVVVVGKL